LAFGFWLLAFGFWLLAFGFWLLAFGFWLHHTRSSQRAKRKKARCAYNLHNALFFNLSQTRA
ncbi:hypothetical protein, partial [Acetobacter senegalensis]